MRLDLAVVFAVVSGEPVSGMAPSDGELAVVAVHRRALEASLGAGRSAPRVDLDLIESGQVVRFRSRDLAALRTALARSDAAFLEAVHSPLVITGGEALAALRPIAARHATTRLAGFYDARIRDALDRISAEKTQTVRGLIALFAPLCTALHLFETGRLEPDLRRLTASGEFAFLAPLLARPDGLIREPAQLDFHLAEAHALRERLDRAVASSVLPAETGADPALDEWVATQRA
jgi:hypothetical protein